MWMASITVVIVGSSITLVILTVNYSYGELMVVSASESVLYVRYSQMSPYRMIINSKLVKRTYLNATVKPLPVVEQWRPRRSQHTTHLVPWVPMRSVLWSKSIAERLVVRHVSRWSRRKFVGH